MIEMLNFIESLGEHMKKIILNSGHEIDIIGSGTNTFGKENKEYRGAINHNISEILTAIEAGYRHFDTAVSYRNESVIARGLKASGLARDKFFITSKIPINQEMNESSEAIEKVIKGSLDALETNYIDLYLIHHPAEDETNLLVWKVLERYYKAGILRSIGVSNFSLEQVQYLLDHGDTKIAVNQIESHPGKWQHELIEQLQALDIAVEAWGPLTRVTPESVKVLSKIGESYNKSWAQVILNYQVERNVIVIPKSHNTQRQKDNLDVFDFKLNNQEKALIRGL